MSGTDKRGKTAMLGAGNSTRRGRRGAANMSGTDKRAKTAMLGAGDSTRRGRRGAATGITPQQRDKDKAAQEAADFNNDNHFCSPVRVGKKGARVKKQAHIVPVTSPIKKKTTNSAMSSRCKRGPVRSHNEGSREDAVHAHLDATTQSWRLGHEQESVLDVVLQEVSSLSLAALACGAPHMEVKITKYSGTSKNELGLFSNATHTISSGTVCAILSTGRRYEVAQDRCVKVTSHLQGVYQRYRAVSVSAVRDEVAWMGAAANEANMQSQQNTSILEVRPSRFMSAGFTILVAIQDIKPGQELLIDCGGGAG